MHPKRRFSTLITMALIAVFVGTANAATVSADYYGMPGFMSGYGSHMNTFRIADLDLDGTNEIILLDGATLVVLDNTGNLLFTKEVEGLDISGWFKANASRLNGQMMGWPGGGGGHMGDDWDWDDMPMSSGRHMGESLEVANLDSDANPEIIIRAFDTLIVLDHAGETQTTITLPDID